MYINISFKKKTAERFQQFSRTHYKTHIDAMAGMLDFFFNNEITPKENFGPTVRRIENSLKKRINAVIKIMKDAERIFKIKRPFAEQLTQCNMSNNNLC